MRRTRNVPWTIRRTKHTRSNAAYASTGVPVGAIRGDTVRKMRSVRWFASISAEAPIMISQHHDDIIISRTFPHNIRFNLNILPPLETPTRMISTHPAAG